MNIWSHRRQTYVLTNEDQDIARWANSVFCVICWLPSSSSEVCSATACHLENKQRYLGRAAGLLYAIVSIFFISFSLVCLGILLFLKTSRFWTPLLYSMGFSKVFSTGRYEIKLFHSHYWQRLGTYCRGADKQLAYMCYCQLPSAPGSPQ